MVSFTRWLLHTQVKTHHTHRTGKVLGLKSCLEPLKREIYSLFQESNHGSLVRTARSLVILRNTVFRMPAPYAPLRDTDIYPRRFEGTLPPSTSQVEKSWEN